MRLPEQVEHRVREHGKPKWVMSPAEAAQRLGVEMTGYEAWARARSSEVLDDEEFERIYGMPRSLGQKLNKLIYGE